jgi:hypothetical protein
MIICFNFSKAKNPETTLLQTEDWHNNIIILENSTNLDRISKSNHEYIQFNRSNNGTNPEYLSCEEVEDDYCQLHLYDHNDVINFTIGNYDNDNSMITV